MPFPFVNGEAVQSLAHENPNKVSIVVVGSNCVVLVSNLLFV